MQTSEALQVFGLESGLNATTETIRAIYRQLAIKNHPDKGGKVELMALINDAKETLARALEEGFLSNCQAASYDLFAMFESALAAIRGIQGITIEACGSWLWVSGDTKTNKDRLKQAGYLWARKKQKWYWRPAGQKRKGKRKSWDMDKIRSTYGSETVAMPQQSAIAS